MCVCVLLYIALDGADLGAGIFSLFVRDEDERGAIHGLHVRDLGHE